MFANINKICVKKYTILIILSLICYSFYQIRQEIIVFEVPKGWPKPTFDLRRNTITKEGFELGRILFYESLLSSDNTISCATCHFQGNAFSHRDHHTSHGVGDVLGERNAISLFNLAWSKDFMWDGSVSNLLEQPLHPITNPKEMNETIGNVIKKLEKEKKYEAVFQKAFGTKDITKERILSALTQFLVMIRSTDTKYDLVMRGQKNFKEKEKKGYDFFKKNCASCHKEPLFTNQEFEYNGLKIDNDFNDIGRMKITNKKQDYLKFRIPSLRNTPYSADYMHDGRYKTLKEVFKHYQNIDVTDTLLPKKLRTKIKFEQTDFENLEAFLIHL